jgi:thiol:disulfide interchange protein
VGLYRLLPVVLIGGGIALAIHHVWVLAAALILMALVGLWLIGLYDRGPGGPRL